MVLETSVGNLRLSDVVAVYKHINEDLPEPPWPAISLGWCDVRRNDRLPNDWHDARIVVGWRKYQEKTGCSARAAHRFVRQFGVKCGRRWLCLFRLPMFLGEGNPSIGNGVQATYANVMHGTKEG